MLYGVKNFLDRYRDRGMTIIPTDSGRSSLVLALRTIKEQGASGTAWIPAYACPSLPSVFRHEGFTLKRYGTTPHFSPVFSSQAPGRKDVALFIHYFGFPNNGALSWIRSRTGQDRPFIIEDCAGSSLSPGIGQRCDFAIFSFRKFLDVPDGGALVSRFPSTAFLGPGDMDTARARNRAFRFLERNRRHEGLYFLREAERRLDRALSTLPRHPTAASLAALGQTCLRTESRIRRKGARELLAAIERIDALKDVLVPLYPSLPAGSVPLLLPARVSRGKDRLSCIFQEAGLECPCLWELNPSLKYAFPAEYRAAQTTVGLPLPYTHGENHFKAIMDCLNLFAMGS